jgi:hypothetical protein
LTIRFLFPSNTGNLTAKISGDANLDCGITENKDGFMVAIARTGPYMSLFAANPVQSGELDFTFYK